jgi:hypothetical protein
MESRAAERDESFSSASLKPGKIGEPESDSSKERFNGTERFLEEGRTEGDERGII